MTIANDSKDTVWMQKALLLAQKAAAKDEVPVGAVIIADGILLGQGWNCPIHTSDPTAHAEIRALRMAARKIKNYRMPPKTTLYVTLEPCAMCAAAIIHARIDQVVFGALDPKTGVVMSLMQFFDLPYHNHKVCYTSEVLAEESAKLLADFFKELRAKK